MKKRFLALIIAMLMLAAVPASATSLFTLPDTSANTSLTAISYGVRLNTVPVSETTLSDGSLQQIYSGVTDESFTTFGIALSENGYTLGEQNNVDNIIAATVINGQITFSVAFDRSAGTLTVVYPTGVTPEITNAFEGYVELKFGDKVRIKDPETGENWGDVVINQFFQNKEYTAAWKYSTGAYNTDNKLQMYLLGSFDSVFANTLKANVLFEATLHYINSDNHYTYPLHKNLHDENNELPNDIGIVLTEDSACFMLSGGSTYHPKWYAPSIQSMEITQIAAGFSNVPDRVRTSTDGIMAITFEFAGVDTPYVLYIRR